MAKNCSNAIDIQKILATIHQDLQKVVDPIYKVGVTRFFKEQIKLYGVRVPNVRKIAANYAADLKQVPLEELWPLCEKLMQTGYIEDATIACALVYKKRAQLRVEDFVTFERWINKYVSNWATCDDLSAHTLGYCVEKYPELLPRIHTWTTAKNPWVRRAAAVSLIVPARAGRNLDDVLKIERALVSDTDDLVQKGCGWMLKEAAKEHQQEIIAFVEQYRSTMPRTMLRYAIECMPKEVKQHLMRR